MSKSIGVITCALAAALAVVTVTSCGKEERATKKVVVVSPHNKDIRSEFEAAFTEYHQAEYGEPIAVEWLDVGGSSDILKYFRNVYGKADTAEVDVAFGGGAPNFQKMAEEGILQPMKLPEGYTANCPATFGGIRMYDEDGDWAGAVVSGFGFLYNRKILEMMDLPEPRSWDDLGKAEYFGQVALADPAHSGSILAVYEMIVQSEDTWPAGWAKLMKVLSNATKYYESSGRTADAVKTETAVAACIDFYGAMRVAQLPDQLVYVSPRGQTAFTPDPIGILKNPPHPELAQRFVDFVLSEEGQRLWALRAGTEGGPAEEALFRTPVRKDVFRKHGDKLLAGITNPYGAGNEMDLDPEMHAYVQEPLKQLVVAAAVKNLDGLRAARERINGTTDADARAKLTARFTELPPDARTPAQLKQLSEKLRDDTQRERIVTDWERFFEDKYDAIAD